MNNTPQNPTTYSNFPPEPQKPKWSTKKKVGVGAAIVLGVGVIGGAIGGGTSNNSGDKKPAVSAQVEDHAAYEVEQQRTQAPATTAPPVRTYDAWPDKPADAIDDIYVEQLNDNGIYAPRTTLIEAGRDGVCVLAGEVDSFTELTIVVMGTTGFDGGDAGTLIGASFAAYCPEHEWLLDQAQGRGI